MCSTCSGLDKLDADLKKALLNLTRSETLFGEEREKSQKAITVLFDNLRTVYVAGSMFSFLSFKQSCLFRYLRLCTR